MSRHIRLIGGALALAACQPQARAIAWFEAHPAEIVAVLSACERGMHRGAECDNARAADGALKAKAREELFRRGFK